MFGSLVNGVRRFCAGPSCLGRCAILLAGSARASIIITEVDAAGSSATYGADWFELTNTDSSPVDITGWKMDDSSASFGSAVALRGVTSIAAGQSVIFAEGKADGSTDSTIDPAFESFWFGSNIPAGFAIGNYGGSGVGLSTTNGDGVNIFDSAGNPIASVSFGALSGNATLDNSVGAGGTLSTYSADGVNSAVHLRRHAKRNRLARCRARAHGGRAAVPWRRGAGASSRLPGVTKQPYGPRWILVSRESVAARAASGSGISARTTSLVLLLFVFHGVGRGVCGCRARRRGLDRRHLFRVMVQDRIRPAGADDRAQRNGQKNVAPQRRRFACLSHTVPNSDRAAIMRDMSRPVIGITTDYNDKLTCYESPYDYAASIEKAGGLPLLIPYRSDLSLIPQYVDLVDGMLFSGGDDLDPKAWGEEYVQGTSPIDPLREKFERALMAEVERRRTPTLGICLGSQLMNVHRGGSMHQFLPTLPRENPIEHRKSGGDAGRDGAGKVNRHEVFLEKDSLAAQAIGKTTINTNTSHKQSVARVGRGLRIIGKAPDGVIEGTEDPSMPLWLGVQWHPERLHREKEHLAVFELLVERASKPR